MIIDHPTTHAEVTAAFAAYETALMTNDVDALDAFFWNSPLALRFGVGKSLFGYDAIAAFRASRGGSPQRVLQSTQITCFNNSYAVATTEFKREGKSASGGKARSG